MRKLLARLLVGTSIVALPLSIASAQTAPAAPHPTPPPVAAAAPAGDAAPPAAPATNGVSEIIVTAQKRSENINKVGISITAQTGEQLLQQNIRSVADLAKVVPGFTYEGAIGNIPVYSIRGIGFHDISLASGQAVAVYTDEVPIPFALETVGVDFDLQRVEVLKGPQGTLFGQNSTGGAINYIAAKPTTDLQAGVDASYGRFAQSDISAFLSGPLTDTLRARVAVRSIQASGWQKRYGPVPVGSARDDKVGQQNQLAGRVTIDWTPTDRLKILLMGDVRRDRSDTQAFQKVRTNPSSSTPLAPEVANFPNTPSNDRAAAWDPGVDYGQDNKWREATARIEYDAGFANITSITAYQKYNRNAPAQDIDGTPYQDVLYGYFGSAETEYQELRASGDFAGKGSWIVGGNYEHDSTTDGYTIANAIATSRILFGLPNPGSMTISRNKIDTYGIYGNVEYPILTNLTLLGGIRYTKADRSNEACSMDRGDNTLGAIFVRIQQALVARGVKTSPVVPIAPGGCVTLDSTYTPGLFTGKLDQDNISWRGGVNWTVTPGTLLYVNVSKGYKSGSFPVASAASAAQYVPVTQESLLSYEAGIKSRIASNLQLNGAAFYYDYHNKQIQGTYIDFVFGRLNRLTSVPKSRVIGFELTADWHPIIGLTLTPGVTYVNSRIQDHFTDFTPVGVREDFNGESFPYAPKWQVTGNGQYEWGINDRLSAFVGTNVAYQSGTNAQFGELPFYRLKPYTLLDLRAGIEAKNGAYRLFVWGTNVLNTYYWTRAGRSFDFDTRNAGSPARYGVTLSYRFK